ncbi:zinc finger BED domain-containing protein RICESLEEPER 2-like [Rhizophagus clarus]|uniref:Zinc finger BED domain-containing protein RICESLEEPER 2-like n=1 Tax=Rhizophagus clarus TaxID=94130 RepID=A0A8H3QUV9_9GLOM|nr:zinc finger BED domain-containing protein RICESLEEPER 2-like [Rhizophagus clarus]
MEVCGAGNEGKTGIEDRDRGKDEEEDKARVEDKTEVKVSVQHSKRGTRSVKKFEVVELAVQQIPGKVALTSDMWMASNSDSFLGPTIHYIDSSWKLKNLLDIIPIKVHYTGVNMASAI